MSERAVPAPGILHIDTERGWRGGERQVLWLAIELERIGFRSVIAARPDEPLAARARERQIEVIPCAPRFEFDPFAVRALRRTARERRIDIVHAHTGHAVTLAALTVWRRPLPMVLTRRVDFRLRRNPGSRWKYRRANAVIAISRAVADALAGSGIARTRIEIIPSGVDLARPVTPAAAATLRELGVPEGSPLVVQVSQLVPHKDPVNFVRAIAVAARTVPRIRALLVGDGPLHGAVEAEVAARRLEGIVTVAGYREDADRLLAAATVVTLSSEEEGLGTVLLEALALGKPVAATRAGGIPEIIEDGVSGLLAPIHDPEALGANIARLCSDRSFAAAVAERARARAARFSVAETARRTAEVYRRLLPPSASSGIR